MGLFFSGQVVKWSRRRNICWKNIIKSTGKCNRQPWKSLDHLETGLVKWSSTTLGINPNKFGSLIEPGEKTWSNGQVVKHLLQIPAIRYTRASDRRSLEKQRPGARPERKNPQEAKTSRGFKIFEFILFKQTTKLVCLYRPNRRQYSQFERFYRRADC